MRKRATNVVATRWRSTNPRSPRDLRWVWVAWGVSSERNPGRKGPDLRVSHECLGVLQESVVLRARRTDFEGVHVLGPGSLFIDDAAPVGAAPRRPGSITRTSMSSVPMKPRSGETGGWHVEQDGPEDVRRAGRSELRPAQEAAGVFELDGGPANAGIRRVERAVDRPLVRRDAGFGRRDQHQRDPDDRQDRENENRDDEGGAALAAIFSVWDVFMLVLESPILEKRSCGG